MTMRAWTNVLSLAAAVMAVRSGPAVGGDTVPLGSAFHYQVQLKKDGVPLNDLCHFRFNLWTNPDFQVGFVGRVDVSSVQVEGGFAEFELDFGFEAFDGTDRWLEVGVACPDPGTFFDYTILQPRQRIAAIPYAMQTRGLFVNDAGDVGIGAQGSSQRMTVQKTNGHIGVNTTSPLGRMHIIDTSLSLSPDAIREDDLIVEDTDAVLGLYSSSSGSVGSTLSMKEIVGGAMTDHWGIWRGSSGGDSALHFSYGSDPVSSSNTSMMTILPTGRVGIGVPNPQSTLDVNGTVNGSRFRARAPGVEGFLHIFDGSGNVALRLDSDNFSGASQFSMFGTNGTSETVEIVAREGDGAARMALRTEGGDTMIEIDALESGGAAVKLLDPATGSVSVSLNSRSGGRVGIGTSSPSGQLHVAGGGGNQSVILPANAIGSGEIVNEAGITFVRENTLAVDPEDGWVTIAKATISCPSAGFIVAIGTTELSNRTLGAPTVTIGLTEFTDEPGPAAQYRVTVPGAGATATGTVQNVTAVTGAGSKTIRLMAETNGDVFAINRAVTLLFVPTAYGAVDTAN